MTAAAYSVLSAIILDHGIVESVKARQACQHMAGENGKPFGAAESADRHFEVVAAPAPLQCPASSRKALDRRPLFRRA